MVARIATYSFTGDAQELGKRAEGHRLTDLALRSTGGVLRHIPFI